MNSVNIIGRTTADLELKYTPSGKAVAQFSLAVNGKPYMKDGEKIEEGVRDVIEHPVVRISDAVSAWIASVILLGAIILKVAY